MSKWADRVILAVRYSQNEKSNKVIDKVKVSDYKVAKSEGDKDKFENKRTLSRTDVIADIKKKITYVTAYKSGKTKGSQTFYNKGEIVIIDTVDSEEYIKTERNNKTEDNLDEIEEF